MVCKKIYIICIGYEWAYWLASGVNNISPGSDEPIMLVCDNFEHEANGQVYADGDGNNSFGIRPLVCLKSNIQLVESGVLDANGYMTYNISMLGVQQEPTEQPHTPISTTDSFVGYYADIEGDGEVDGVIYADLLVAGSEQWGNIAGAYTIDTIPSAKAYYVSRESYTDQYFGEHPVISPMGEGADRFYIMALSDISSDRYYWYRNGNISDYGTQNQNVFGTGKTNTSRMLEAWNNEEYGAKTTGDMWGAIEEGWFVPSIGEWKAFGDAFYITSTNYRSTYGLSDWYWSSSPDGSNTAVFIDFSSAYIYFHGIFRDTYVRLSATF